MNTTVIAGRRFAAIFLSLSLIAGTIACEDSEYRKASRAGAGIASGLQVLQGVNEDAYDAKLIEPQETIVLAQYISEATRANDEFVKQLGAFRQLKPGDRAALAIWFGGITRSLDALNQHGILRVKNPQARERLSVAFAAVQASANILAQLFAAYAPPGVTDASGTLTTISFFIDIPPTTTATPAGRGAVAGQNSLMAPGGTASPAKVKCVPGLRSFEGRAA